MRRVRWLTAVVGLVLAGCVSKAEFNDYKAKIKADGDAVDEWIAVAHEVIKWVSANGAKFCDPPGSCDPPVAPTSPPPNGGWGL